MPPHLVDTLARLVGLPDRLSDDDKAAELASELALNLRSLGLRTEGLGALRTAWADQLPVLLVLVEAELRAYDRAEVEFTAQRKGTATQRAAEGTALQGLFDQAETPHNWLLDKPLPGDEGSDA